ncbi:hypothetical protein vBSdyM006_107 [Shigella phage vB_SdyM_006]|nr:hypothetical protein vBSdyM006_107 [Shigella phage vB_SdyM_006]
MNYLLSQINKVVFIFLLVLSGNTLFSFDMWANTGAGFAYSLLFLISCIVLGLFVMFETINLGFDKETVGDIVISLSNNNNRYQNGYYSVPHKLSNIYMMNTIFMIMMYILIVWPFFIHYSTDLLSMILYSIGLAMTPFILLFYPNAYFDFLDEIKGDTK